MKMLPRSGLVQHLIIVHGRDAASPQKVLAFAASFSAPSQARVEGKKIIAAREEFDG